MYKEYGDCNTFNFYDDICELNIYISIDCGLLY